jgi:precorrin-3B C17-methyltransferase
MGYRQMKHELYVIGMGPGREEKMTLEALQALEACDTIVGYTV